MEAASEHEEHDVWQGVHTLLGLPVSYVPAGQAVKQASLRGLRLFVEHFVQVIRVFPALLAGVSSEHSAQLSMPPFAAVLQRMHFFLFSTLSLGKYPVLQSFALTQEVVGVALETVFR